MDGQVPQGLCCTFETAAVGKGRRNIETPLGNGKSLAGLLCGFLQRAWQPQGNNEESTQLDASWDGMGCFQRHGRKTKGQRRPGYWLDPGQGRGPRRQRADLLQSKISEAMPF